MAKWLSLSGRTAGADVSVVELVGQRLIEHELWDWFGLGGIEGRSLVEEEVPWDGPRAGEIGGGVCGSSRCSSHGSELRHSPGSGSENLGRQKCRAVLEHM